MERRARFCFDSLTAITYVAVCAVIVAMLLFLPANRVHCFGNHFRTPEVRRTIERQTPVAYSTENARERVARSELLPTFFAPTETSSKIVPLDNVESTRQVPLSRLLNRLKLHPSGSSGRDPLPQA